MRHRMLVAAGLTLGLVAAACSRQPTSSGQGPIAVGRTAPAFSLKSASGGTVSLSEFAGKPVLLYFSMGPG
jgi:cytochrome oxidase Cu insertion factor (SCO1/SenC/PrrC family)